MLLKYIIELNALYTEGWHPGRKKTDGVSSLTLVQYYKFLLHERPDRFARRTRNYILQAGKLMMEFVVMAFLMTQDQKLRWCRKNQKKLRAETYKNGSKHVEAGDNVGFNHGKNYITCNILW